MPVLLGCNHDRVSGSPLIGAIDVIDAVGVDGWRQGWVAAHATDDGTTWTTHAAFAEILRAYPDAHIGIDMPIGLPAEGSRACDLQARAFAVGAPSSVFPAPPRALVDGFTAQSVYEPGRHISKQAWNLIEKIKQVDDVISPVLQARIAEVHPECCFRAMAPATRFESKKTARGVGQRIAALVEQDLLGPRMLTDWRYLPPGVPLDDVLDASAALWTARRWRAGGAVVLPTDPPAERDGRGLLMQIRY